MRPGVSASTIIAARVHYSDYPEPRSIEIPYTADFSRWRLPEPRPNGQKYHQEPGTGVRLYYPPAFFHHNGTPLFGLLDACAVLIEGEFKALALLECGVYTIGLPGITTYLKNKETGIRQLLPDLQATLVQERIKHVYFLGDADTCTNYAFGRNAAFLANTVRPDGIKVYLPNLPLSGPKGIDDCKEKLGDGFGAFFTNVIKEAILL